MKEKHEALTDFNCMNCTKKIPRSRLLKKCYTCSNLCADAVRREVTRLLHETRCRMCHRPATRQQMVNWHRWAKANGLILERGRPRSTPKPELEQETKTLAETESAVQSKGTSPKKSRS